jgi:response regulator RpfG family c-di-GMP phosphodiesterase
MLHFLLVEDDSILCIVQSAIIRQVFPNCMIEIACSAEETLNFLQSIEKNHQNAPDYILIDLHLCGIDGLEMVENFSEKQLLFLQDTELFILSATIDPRVIDRIQNNNRIKGFLEKPLSKDILLKNFQEKNSTK